MKVHYDESVDALFLSFSDAPTVDTEEVAPGIMLDFDDEGRIVAIEILDARKHLAADIDFKALTAA
jgi:uncharacterized protein YuzE